MVTGATAAGVAPGPPEDLCLGFANTRFWRGTDTPTEILSGPADLLQWCAVPGGLDGGLRDRIAAHWRAEPAAGVVAFQNAIALREALYRIFATVAAGGGAADADLVEVNR